MYRPLFVLGALLLLVSPALCGLQEPDTKPVLAEEGNKKWKPPSWYHGHDGPEFKHIKTSHDIELRRYRSSKWVTTNITDMSFDDAWKEGAKRLDDYWKGDNEPQASVDTTVPKFSLMYPASGERKFESKFTMEYFLPHKLFDEPPAPTKEELNIVNVPEQDVYIRVIGGYPHEQDVIDQAFGFMDQLKKEGLKFDKDFVGFAQYDDPIHVIKRHNEIWIWAKKQPSEAAAATVAVVGEARASAVQEEVQKWKPPSWYHKHDGPEFELIKTSDDIELRRYRSTKWVTTNITDTKFDDAWTEGTKRLDGYWKGDNEPKTDVDDTVPAFVLMYPSGERQFEARFTMEYFLPHKLFDEPPAPTKEEINIVNVPDQEVWVKVFGGFAKEQDVVEQAFGFMDELKKQGVKIDEKFVGFAQYDDPIHIINRHNEIWIWAEQQPSKVTAIEEASAGAFAQVRRAVNDMKDAMARFLGGRI